MLYLVSIAWSFLCWLEIFNTGKLYQFATFVTGGLFAIGLMECHRGSALIAFADILPTFVVLGTYLAVRRNRKSDSEK